VVGQDKDDYFAIYCRKDMVMSRIASPGEYERLNRKIRYALDGASAKSIMRIEESLRRRLGSGRSGSQRR